MKRKFLRYGIVAVLTAVFLSSVAAYALTPDIGEYYRTMGLAEEITYPTAREKRWPIFAALTTTSIVIKPDCRQKILCSGVPL